MRKSRSIRSTYSVLLDPRFSSQSRENKAPQGINVERSQREIRPGAGTDAVQEETGELDYYPTIDIIFHEDPVVQYLTFAVFYEQPGMRASRSARSGLAARPWSGGTRGF
jgi:hypothetical protein